MLRLLLVPVFALLLGLACSDDDSPEPTAGPTGDAPGSSPTAISETPGSASSPTAAPGTSWDETAVWGAGYYGGDVFGCLEEAPDKDIRSCVLDVARNSGLAQPAIDFIEANEAVLVAFEELGVVDYGEVSWVAINMGRQEPVLLNGDFGLRYYGQVVPEDWRTAHASYEAIEVDESGVGPYPWAEYSALVESSSGPEGQRLVFESVIQECRACQPVGFLALEVNFNAEGEQTGVEVLPLRCEPEAGAFVDVIVAQGVCPGP